MSHELYIFGSVVRGEVSATSDVDVLVVPLGGQPRESYPPGWSVYSAGLIASYYRLGRLFAWHLHREARCLFPAGADNLLARLGPPAPYATARADVADLAAILAEAVAAVRGGTNSLVYELGVVHTALRDVAMSASWALLGEPDFSRESPYRLPVPCPLPRGAYRAATLARHQSTRGAAARIDLDSVAAAVLAAPLSGWVEQIRSQL